MRSRPMLKYLLILTKHGRLLTYIMLYSGSTDKFTFQNCRQSNSERFALSGCPSGRYIAIQLAEIGFNARWRGDYPQHRCKERDVICKKSTGHSGILACNGRRTCSFGHGVLTFPQGGVQKLCSRHRDANFISVRYQCINGMLGCTCKVR